MWWAADKRALIAWDGQRGPTTHGYARYLVERRSPGGSYASIGETHGEAFLDRSVKPGRVYQYRVTGVRSDASDQAVGPETSVQTKNRPPGDVTAPTAPQSLVATGVDGGIRLDWKPSADAESGLLCYFVRRSSEPVQADFVLWEKGQHLSSWTDAVPNGTTRTYEMCALDHALNVSPVAGPVTGTAHSHVTPPPPAVLLRNFFANPRFHVNVTDGWYAAGEDMSNTHETDADLITILPEWSGSFSRQIGDWMSLPDTGPFFLRAAVKVDQDNSDMGVSRWALAYECGHGWDFWSIPTVVGEWQSVWAYFPSSAAGNVRLDVVWNGATPSGQALHLTNLRCDLGSDPGGNPDPGYYDGDSAGWQWDGTPHNSTSRSIP